MCASLLQMAGKRKRRDLGQEVPFISEIRSEQGDVTVTVDLHNISLLLV